MFTELLPLLKDGTLMLIIADTGGENLRVNVIPQRRSGKENDAAEKAFTSPLTITGTADELDRELESQLAGFRVSLERLKSNLGEVESAHATALKTIEEERKKELSSKKKSTATVRAAVRNDSETPSTPANEKPVFGSKVASTACRTTQSLFDSGPATPAEDRLELQPEKSSEPKTEALADTAESTVSSQPPAARSDKPSNRESPAECGICHGPILRGQERHSLMPFPAHASASDCEAARRSRATVAN
jgi:PRTRC genetic system protein E